MPWGLLHSCATPYSGNCQLATPRFPGCTAEPEWRACTSPHSPEARLQGKPLQPGKGWQGTFQARVAGSTTASATAVSDIHLITAVCPPEPPFTPTWHCVKQTTQAARSFECGGLKQECCSVEVKVPGTNNAGGPNGAFLLLRAIGQSCRMPPDKAGCRRSGCHGPASMCPAVEHLYHCVDEGLFCLVANSNNFDIIRDNSEVPAEVTLCLPRPAGCGAAIGSPCCPGEPGAAAYCCARSASGYHSHGDSSPAPSTVPQPSTRPGGCATCRSAARPMTQRCACQPMTWWLAGIGILLRNG